MKIVSKPATEKGTPDRFHGDVWLDVIVRGEPPSHVRVSMVRFAPGARNAWHAHAVGQTLHITEGVGLVQASGAQPIEVRAGDTIYTPPGEWHWHGATRDHFMTHLAVWEAPEQGEETVWGEHVSDEDYAAGS